MRAKFLLFPLAVMIVSALHPADAQPAGKVYRIGVLISGIPAVTAPLIDAFQQGLRELGYVEGKNYVLEIRRGEDKLRRVSSFRAREIYKEFVRLNVDIVVTTETGLATGSRVGKVPIVRTAGYFGDSWAGIAHNLARPGGSVTGLTTMSPELAGKRLELLTEALPQVSRVAVLLDPRPLGAMSHFIQSRSTARALGRQLESLPVQQPEDFEQAFQTARKGHIEALIVVATLLMHNHGQRIVNLEAKTRLPVMYTDQRFVLAGGLMSYGANDVDIYRRAATYVDKILKGAKPGDLPIERPRKFDLVINLKTAKQLGITIPSEVLFQADRLVR
jgi:ABC-type uncharacterized transport system substrate-binding protein